MDNSIVIARPDAYVRLMNLPSLTTRANEVQTMDSGPHALDDDFVNDSFRLCFRKYIHGFAETEQNLSLR